MNLIDRWKFFILLLAVALAFSLVGCLDDIRYNMPCRIPQDIEEHKLLGIWQLKYHNYINPDSESAKITGTETLILLSNGTYIQVFDGPGYVQIGPVHEWKLITDEGDGPKLAMTDLRYYANGVEWVDGPLLLRSQKPDLLRYKQIYPLPSEGQAKLTVKYPEDGFVYLYPRYCLGKLVLLQMVSGFVDPDDLTVHNPVFSKLGE